MDQNALAAIYAGLCAAAATTAGIMAVRRHHDWARRNSIHFVNFAAGILITVSFLHLLPESFGRSRTAPLYLLAGYLLTYGIERFLKMRGEEGRQGAAAGAGLLFLFGIGLHSFIDGIVYAVGFGVSLFTGILVALGMVLHEVPEGMITYTLLVRGGFTSRQALLLAFFAAALTTPAGAVAAYPFLTRLDTAMMGNLLAFSGGVLVYLGATHLLPQAGENANARGSLTFVGGVALAIVTALLGE